MRATDRKRARADSKEPALRIGIFGINRPAINLPASGAKGGERRPGPEPRGNVPDSFKDTDSTALIGVEYEGRMQKNVYDRRVGNTAINAYVYTASFRDGSPAWTIMVNPEFGQTEAKALAEKYSRNIGQMPICIRSGITGAVIHDGVNPWGGGNPLTIHHGQGLDYERSGILTETMIHESTHAAFDRLYYDAEWKAAAEADGQFISTYARDNPDREDHSETFLCWLAVRYKKDRLPQADYAKITAAVPNRLKWYDKMDFRLSPMVGGATAVDLDRPMRPSRPAGFALPMGGYGPVRPTVAIAYDLAGRKVPVGAYSFRLSVGDFPTARSGAVPR